MFRSNNEKDLATAVTMALRDAQLALAALINNSMTLECIQRAGVLLAHSLSDGGRVFACGNGGSMFDAMHFAEELAGRYRDDRAGLPAIAISDPGHLTGVANDFGYDQIFSRFLRAHARAGDVLLAVSTSGASPNVLKAAAYARSARIKVIGLSGRFQCPLADLTDVHIATEPQRYSDRVQELHIKVLHILIELTERQLFPANYAGPA